MALAVPGLLKVATYERVSSEGQRERETIKTQRDALDRRLASEPGVEFIDRYVDDGVSGSKKVVDRPDGRRLLTDAEAGRFNVLWVYRLDRLGRDLVDLAIVGRRLRQLGIRLISMTEGEPDPFMFDITAAIAENEKRVLRQRTGDGVNAAAKQGRYTGGIVAFGYVAQGQKATSHLVPDTVPLTDTLDVSAADVVRQMYHRLAIDGWSCRRIAAELNDQGVPTSYARAGRTVKRGERQQRTQGLWRSGRIRNMVCEPKYMGRLEYGRRATERRETIAAAIEPLVTPELWAAAQEALARNRVCAKNTRRAYLLKSVMRCALCGLTYVGTFSQAHGWYRCGGQLVERGPNPGRCLGHAIRADALEPAVWADVERFLRDPGEVLDALDGPAEREVEAAIAEADAIALRRALEGLAAQRGRAIALNIRDRLSDAELDAELDRIAAKRTELEDRLAALEAPQADPVPEAASQLLDEVRERLKSGLSDVQRQEIVRLLVGIRIETEIPDDGGKKTVRAVIEYRFPFPTSGVVQFSTARGSSPPRTGTQPGRSPIVLPGQS